MGHLNAEKKWVFPLVISSLVCVFILATSFNMGLVSSVNTINTIFSLFRSRALTNQTIPNFAEAKVSQAPSPPPRPPIPKFAYLISGSRGDLEKLWRTLHALYHPWNYYIVHLDLESPPEERLELASRVEKHPIFTNVGNVYMNEKANMVTYRGPTMVANTLHACAILLRNRRIGIDLLYTFSELKRGLNFMEHTSDLGWKATHRAMPLIVDPGLYESTKSDIFWVAPNRNLPTAFKLFTGSAWMILSRTFVEYIIWGLG
ncbi:UNVERIFIED_CONTAM: Beta-glucuronosyltransferase GlcAT14B [Sesamum radiatum]|uniref:Beta-glucuronosyltransferase GlcAT14B n=1 Tax=Sesamum radiatum TaxID=300843 RepID=A0AAW2T4M8_SESRA